MWYKKAQELGLVVRGEIQEDTNSFDRNNTDDIYIQCSSKNKIYCLTGDIPYNRNHEYMGCIFSYGKGMNMLRKFYENKIDTINKIQMVKKGKVIWKDEKMISEITNKTNIERVELVDGEIYIYSKDLKLLSTFMKAKKIKNKKDPFHEDYLDWSNKYKIPEKDLKKYKKYFENQTKSEALVMGREVSKLNEEFKRKHPRKLSKAKKRLLKIKDFKAYVHHEGLWSSYVKFIGENL